MTTITTTPDPTYDWDPAAGLPTHVSVADTVSQTMTMAWRATLKMRRNFEQFFDVTIQPLLFTAMFAYIFGGAVSGDVKSYLPLLITGMIAQTVLTACSARTWTRASSTGSGCSRSPGSRRWPDRWSPTCCATPSPRRSPSRPAS
jgi:hypothetical protein